MGKKKKIPSSPFPTSKGPQSASAVFLKALGIRNAQNKCSAPGEILNSLHQAGLIKYVCLYLFFFLPQSISICLAFTCEYTHAHVCTAKLERRLKECFSYKLKSVLFLCKEVCVYTTSHCEGPSRKVVFQPSTMQMVYRFCLSPNSTNTLSPMGM